MSEQNLNTSNILDDISQNISYLLNDISINNYSSQLNDISLNLQHLNTKINSVIELYNVLNNVKSKLNT